MSKSEFTMRQLMEAGVHFGHHKRRWNPKMSKYIFGTRNNIHIMNLDVTVPLLKEALNTVENVVSQGGRVLFVATKRQAQEHVAEAAKKCGQYFVNYRWLGGMLTNWKTVSNSIRQLKNLREVLAGDTKGLTKKETLNLTREYEKLELVLGGISEMPGLPDLVFIIDTNKESIAVQEARKLGIPVVAIVDSNSDPDGVDYIVPGNDDATRAIEFYCDIMSRAVLAGIERELKHSGRDIGASDEPTAKSKKKKVEGQPSAKAEKDSAVSQEAKAPGKTASVAEDKKDTDGAAVKAEA